VSSGCEEVKALINLQGIRVFQNTNFYYQAVEAQEFMGQNEHLIRGWLNFTCSRVLMEVRLQIDLNSLGLTPANAELFGWHLEQPITITLSTDDFVRV